MSDVASGGSTTRFGSKPPAGAAGRSGTAIGASSSMAGAPRVGKPPEAAGAAGSSAERRRGSPTPVAPSVRAARSTGTATGASGSMIFAGAAISARTEVVWSWAASYTKRPSGKRTVVTVPLPSLRRENRTRAWRRRARRPTTSSPSRCEDRMVSVPMPRTRSLASANSSADIPRPESTMVTMMKPPSTPVEIATVESGSENTVAFSSNSASKWAADSALKPCMDGSICRSSNCTRSYCSISDCAVRITSVSGRFSRIRRPESMPASTRRDSAFRRIRVAKWSRRKRSASTVGSSSLRSN